MYRPCNFWNLQIPTKVHPCTTLNTEYNYHTTPTNKLRVTPYPELFIRLTFQTTAMRPTPITLETVKMRTFVSLKLLLIF